MAKQYNASDPKAIHANPPTTDVFPDKAPPIPLKQNRTSDDNLFLENLTIQLLKTLPPETIQAHIKADQDQLRGHFSKELEVLESYYPKEPKLSYKKMRAAPPPELPLADLKRLYILSDIIEFPINEKTIATDIDAYIATRRNGTYTSKLEVFCRSLTADQKQLLIKEINTQREGNPVTDKIFCDTTELDKVLTDAFARKFAKKGKQPNEEELLREILKLLNLPTQTVLFLNMPHILPNHHPLFGQSGKVEGYANILVSTVRKCLAKEHPALKITIGLSQDKLSIGLSQGGYQPRNIEFLRENMTAEKLLQSVREDMKKAAEEKKEAKGRSSCEPNLPQTPSSPKRTSTPTTPGGSPARKIGPEKVAHKLYTIKHELEALPDAPVSRWKKILDEIQSKFEPIANHREFSPELKETIQFIERKLETFVKSQPDLLECEEALRKGTPIPGKDHNFRSRLKTFVSLVNSPEDEYLVAEAKKRLALIPPETKDSDKSLPFQRGSFASIVASTHLNNVASSSLYPSSPSLE